MELLMVQWENDHEDLLLTKEPTMKSSNIPKKI